ncbi:MAG: hypothetical protein WD382_05750 [Halofilum sp. (in: g-proteobacteria)]
MNAQIEHRQSSTRAPSGASTRDIESALSANREALEHTLTELQQRVSAEGLTQMAMERLRSESGVQFLQELRDTVVHNPMPITVIALGMIWAAMSERGGDGSSRRIGSDSAAGGEDRDDLVESVHQSAGKIRHRASTRWSEARERTRDLMGRGRERFSSSGSSMGESSEHGAMARARDSTQRGWEFTREHPILMAGAGIAVGAAVAALLPTTRMERERVGPMRDEALSGGARFASEAGRGAAAGVSDAELSAEADSAQSEWSAQTEQPVPNERPGAEPNHGSAGPETERRTETSEEPAHRPV